MNIIIHNAQFGDRTGGTERLIAQQIAHFIDKGAKVTLFTLEPELPSELFLQACANKNLSVRTVKKAPVLKRAKYDAHDPRRWYWESIVLGRQAHTIYAENKAALAVTHLATDVLSVPRGTPTVLHLHGIPRKSSAVDALAITRPERIYSVAPSVTRGWRALYPSMPRVQLLFPGVDTHRFSPVPSAYRSIDVLTIGRLVETKGIAYLLQALERIPGPLEVVIAGLGPERAKLMEQARGLEHRVSFPGYIDDDALPELYQNARVCAFPSIGREGVLITMLEAAACGRPIVTTDGGGMSEFLRDGKNGLLVRATDPDGLSRAIGDLLRRPSWAESLGRQAASDTSTWDIHSRLNTWIAAYEEVLYGGNRS